MTVAEQTLELLAPGLLGPVPERVLSALPEVGEFPALRRLLTRASRESVPVGTPDSLIGQVLGVNDPGAGGPIAAAGMAGEGGGYWSRAAGCHLLPDRDRLMVRVGDSTQPDADEADAIRVSFNHAFGDQGWQLYRRGGMLALRSEAPLPPGLGPPREVSGGYLNDYLPAGADHRQWRALFNELQMLLFEHPVNEAREARGLDPINSLWFWGCGRALDTLTRTHARIHAGAPIFRGLAELTGGTLSPSAERLSQIDATAGPVLAHWPDAESALINGDVTAWLASLAGFEERWAGEALASLANGTWRNIVIHALPGARLRCTAGGLRRFWRRPRALHHYIERV